MACARHLFLAAIVALAVAGCSGKEEAPPSVPIGVFITPQGTSSEQTVFVRGTAASDTQVEVHFGAACEGQPAASGASRTFSGSGIQTVVPPNATVFITARARRGEKVSACSDPAAYTHDDIPPAVPLLSPVTLLSAEMPLRVRVLGTAEAQARVRVFNLKGCAGMPQEVKAGTSGVYLLETEVTANATTHFSAQAVDAAGNISGCSAHVTFDHDNLAPAPPLVLATTPPSPAKASSIGVHGTAEPGSRVRLFKDLWCGQALSGEVALAAADGKFQLQVTVGLNTSTSLHATATDAAGNVSACSSGLTYVHDTLPPPVPLLSNPVPASPSATATTFQVTVQGEAQSVLTIHGEANCTGQIVLTGTLPAASASANLTVPANASRTFSARAVDAAGNTSGCSAPLTLTHDNTPPPAPLLAGTNPTSPGNASTVTVYGTAEPLSTVQLFRSATCGTTVVTSVTANASGAFSASLTVTANSVTQVTARARDTAGNTSACSTPISYTHDSIAPSMPVLAGTEPPSPGTSLTPTIWGLGETGATIQIFATAGCAGSPAATAVPGPAAPGGVAGRGPFFATVQVAALSTTALSANAKDGVGNTSGCASLAAYVHDPMRGWREVQNLGGPQGGAFGPALVWTPEGATAAWGLAHPNDTSSVLFADLAGGAWSSPTPVDGPGGSLTGPPRLSADLAGNAHLVWARELGGATTAWSSYRPAQGGWTPALSFGADTYEPDVAAGANGEAIAAFRLWNGNQFQIHASRFTAGAWEPPARVDTTSFNDYAPRVGLTSLGEGLVLFTENTGTLSAPADALWSARRINGLWQFPQRRTTTSGRVRRGDYLLRTGTNGSALAAWTEVLSGYSTARPFVAAFGPAGFATATTLSTSSQDARSIDLWVNEADVAMVSWAAGSANLLQFSRNATGSWAAAQAVHSAAPAAAGAPSRIVQDAAGNAVAAWIMPNRMESGHGLWVATYSPGVGWSVPRMVEMSVDPLDTFDLFTTSTRTLVVWTRAAGGGTRTVHARALE